MNEQNDFERFKHLSFTDFKSLALDDTLSMYEKIGFPDSYRKGKEELIFSDIINKLELTDTKGKTILDIGSGCSGLAHLLMDHSNKNSHKLLLVDHAEMLDLLTTNDTVEKHPGYFPDDTKDLIDRYRGEIDTIICYSVIQYVFYNTCIFKFIDNAVGLLKEGGKMLIGDIPNASKRKRFFESQEGIEYHRKFTNSQSMPGQELVTVKPGDIEDGVVMSILERYKNLGYQTERLSQPEELPMAGRREDILITKP